MWITYKALEDHEGWDRRPTLNEQLGQEPRGGFAPWAKRVPPTTTRKTDTREQARRPTSQIEGSTS